MSEYKTLRLWLEKELRNLEVLDPVLFESNGAKPISPRAESLRLARECDIYIGIFGANDSEMTKQEFIEAYNTGKPCFVYDETVPNRDLKLSIFIKDEVIDKVTYGPWTSEPELLQKVKTNLLDYITHLAPTGLNVKKPIEQTASKGGATCPTVTITPSVGGVGSDIHISGTGFQPQEQLQLFIGQEKLASKIFRSDDGGYVTWVKTPNLSCGNYVLKVQSNNGTAAASVFKIIQSINLKPSFASKGATPVLSGSGFAGESYITVRFSGKVLPFKKAIVTTNRGDFSTPISIPKEVIPGTYTIDVRDAIGNGVMVIFTIVTPVISVSPTAGRTGATVQITGTGFNSDSILQISLSGYVTTLRTTDEGIFSGSITIPKDITPAYHKIIVSDEAGNIAAATLQIVT
jgi:hypothetical protein